VIKRLLKIDYSSLAYAGAVPFGFGAFCMVMGWQQLAPFGDIGQFLASYSLLIIAFMAGCHWSQQFAVTDSWQRRLPLLSNAVALLVWASYLWLPLVGFLAISIIAFALLLAIDKRLYRAGHIGEKYWQVRLSVSSFVQLSLLISIFSL